MNQQDRVDIIAKILAVEKFKKKRLLDHDIPRMRRLVENILDVKMGTPTEEQLIAKANSQMIIYLLEKYG